MNIKTTIIDFWDGLNWRGRVVAILGIAIASIVFWYVVKSGWRWVRGDEVSNQVQTIQQSVNQDLQQAATHRENAQAADVRREYLDPMYQAATEKRQAAAKQSSRSMERVRVSTQAYEKTLHANPSEFDYVLSDDELCARLAKLDIACR